MTPLFNKAVGNDEVILLRRDALFCGNYSFYPDIFQMVHGREKGYMCSMVFLVCTFFVSNEFLLVCESCAFHALMSALVNG